MVCILAIIFDGDINVGLFDIYVGGIDGIFVGNLVGGLFVIDVGINIDGTYVGILCWYICR